MALLKKMILACSPLHLAEKMERESRQWIMRCPSGHEKSVWDAGGLRVGAIGNPSKLVWCSKCERLRWQRLYKQGQREVIDKGSDPPKENSESSRAGGHGPLAIVAMVFTMIGTMFVCGALVSFVPWAAWLSQFDTTTGVVISNVAQGDRYFPRVRFEVDHQTYFVDGQLASSQSKELGQEVEVRYNPQDPSSAQLVAFSVGRLLQTIFASIGTVFLCLGLLGQAVVRLARTTRTTVALAADSPQ